MMKKISVLLLIILSSCTEPYLLQSSNFEEALVIEATITNEFKKQQIKISKTYRLEESVPEFIENANVSIEDDLGTIFNFIEGDEIYESENQFQAIPGRKYKLTIVSNGKTYVSTQETLTTENQIESLEVFDKTINNVRGAEIILKSYDPTKSSKYYRYEYEETYKIIAPKWLPYTVSVNPTISTELIFTPRTYEAKTCYSTIKSNELLLHTTTDLLEDKVEYTTRFIPVNNPIIAHRYSILVKQYIQNLESYTYHNTLKNISGIGSILSQNQPGFFSGNITCNSNQNEKVIGFFEVSSVSSKRIFFNFEDVFPNTIHPDYFYDCYDNCMYDDPYLCDGTYNYCFNFAPPSTCNGNLAIDALNNGNVLYFSGPNPLNVVPLPCGDCTAFSSNVVPPFWQ